MALLGCARTRLGAVVGAACLCHGACIGLGSLWVCYGGGESRGAVAPQVCECHVTLANSTTEVAAAIGYPAVPLQVPLASWFS